MKVKIAMLQMEVLFSEREKNLEKAEKLVQEAKALGAEICVLPECLDLGWGNTDAPLLAQPIPGPTSDFYCRLAREQQVFLAAGLTEKAGDKVYNAALLISDTGEILHKHRKISVLHGVEDVYSVGDRLGVADTKYGKIALDICADNLEDSLPIGMALGKMDADLLLSPCAWAVRPDRDVVKEPYGDEWHVPYKILSETFSMPVIGVSNVGQVDMGPWKGWKAIGNSIAYDSDGTPAAILPYGETAETIRIIEVTLPRR